jgi:hypothetical protein
LGEMGPKTYVLRCFVRQASLLGRVRRHMDELAKVKRMREGVWRDCKSVQLVERHTTLVKHWETWWLTLSSAFKSLARPSSPHHAEWLATLHLLYYGGYLELHVLSHPTHNSPALDRVAAMDACMLILDYIDRECRCQMHPPAIRTVEILCKCYGLCIQATTSPKKQREWRLKMERCFSFACTRGLECILSTQLVHSMGEHLAAVL